MNLLAIGLTSFIIALSGALVPGPLFTVTVGESVKNGASAGPLIILGHGILELIIVVLLLSGVSPLIAHGSAKNIVKFAGGIMLIIMGLLMLKDIRNARIDLSAGGAKGGSSLVLTGIIGSLSNPYWIIWWATIGLGYLISSLKFGIAGIVLFFAGHILADLLWYSLISCAVAKGRKVIGDRGYRLTLFVCACFLILFGIWFVGSMAD